MIYIVLEELINGWTVDLPNCKKEFFETKREALGAIEMWVNEQIMYEFKLLTEGAGKQ